MPRPRPPYLQRHTTRHGKAVWYVWVRPNPRIRIRGEYGTPEFTAAYQAALQGKAVEAPDAGSARWYAVMAAGALPRDERVARPVDGDATPAREHLPTCDGDFGARAVHRCQSQERDGGARPAIGQPRRRPATFSTRCEVFSVGRLRPIWSRSIRLRASRTRSARRARASPSGPRTRWSAIKPAGRSAPKSACGSTCCCTQGCGAVMRSCSAASMCATAWRPSAPRRAARPSPLRCPILPILQATLDAGPTGELAYICGGKGKPLTKESFGNMFKDACVEAEVSWQVRTRFAQDWRDARCEQRCHRQSA